MTKLSPHQVIYKNYNYESKLAEHMSKYISLNREHGRLFNVSATVLNFLDKFIVSRSEFNDGSLSKDCILTFVEQYDEEHYAISSIRNICSVISQFAKYLLRHDIPAYIYPTYTLPAANKDCGYIPSHEQIIEVFAFIDRSYQMRHRNTLSEAAKIVILRVLYVCGMRISEVTGLSVEDVDLENGCITIYGGKGNVSRTIWILDDLRGLLMRYDAFISKRLPRRLYFFECTSGKINRNAVTSWFKQSWKRCFPESTEETTPVLHSLRHAMVIRRIDLWGGEQSHEFSSRLPVLSYFLGHKDVHSTFYYYHTIRGHGNAISKTINECNDVAKEIVNARII